MNRQTCDNNLFRLLSLRRKFNDNRFAVFRCLQRNGTRLVIHSADSKRKSLLRKAVKDEKTVAVGSFIQLLIACALKRDRCAGNRLLRLCINNYAGNHIFGWTFLFFLRWFRLTLPIVKKPRCAYIINDAEVVFIGKRVKPRASPDNLLENNF